MDISVVVPTYNRRDLVLRTLRTVFDQDWPASGFEVVVVSDGSSDGTVDALKTLNPPCALTVIQQENRGQAAARNRGYRASKSDLILFLDDDMLCEPGLVAAHVRAHRESLEQDSREVVGFGALFLSADSRRSLAAECFHREIGAFYLSHSSDGDAELRITDCTFSNASIRRRVLEEHDGFDERFRTREDLELGLRLFRAGIHAKYVSEAVARQYYDKSSADLIRDAEAFAAADVLLAMEHPNERIEGQVLTLREQSWWRRAAYRTAARVPGLVDLVLAPACGLGEALIDLRPARELGVRALQFRRKAHWLGKVLADPRWKSRSLPMGKSV
ncbi:MAG TPA: glycosyltransferase family 2 protein [Terracidiphilus sp.]|jgi:glycosyltransferase involved in cell wall biosynthesis|nr:glycosyltransferase family 2 protein [Terracidiphilus sp.]